MIVQKFGGTSVGSPQRMHAVADLINDQQKKVGVLSAVSGTTNALVAYDQLLKDGNKDEALSHINKLFEDKYKSFAKELCKKEELVSKADQIIQKEFDVLKSHAADGYKSTTEREILAQGEIISTQLFQVYLEELGLSSALIPALDFMRIDENDEPDMDQMTQLVQPFLDANTSTQILITQGYICRNPKGEVDNLKRGGSDYTASLVGAAIKGIEIQIWTDIDGMHNNDPRIVKETNPVAELSFDEAAELAYFGAKILHPTCINPARTANIPVKLLNTMEPKALGTTISTKSIERKVKAIAAKDNITAIKIKSGRMLLAYGFLKKVFEIFEKYKTPIDVITTSEIAVSLTIDDTSSLDAIIAELNQFGTTEVDGDLSIICIVGNFVSENTDAAIKGLSALREIPLRMISYGGSRHNITIVLDQEKKNEALNLLNDNLF